MKSMQVDLSGKQVLVTGGTGFIGGRLVEKLVLECEAQVRVLVRSFTTTSRIARFPLEMIQGDVADTEAVRRAADGCEVIFHCVYGNKGTARQRRAATVGGTEAVAKAALATGASRMVHVSTISVYGRTPDGDLDETAPRRRSGDFYADTKLKAERLVFNYYRKYGLPVVVIQPTIVYGPFAAVWTVEPLQQLRTGRIVLVNGGDGLCNAVYVDDVVQAMILAATQQNVVGKAFLVSGEAPVTWRDFYCAYERMLGVSGTVSMSAAEAKAYAREQRKARSILNQALNILREEPAVRERVLRSPEVATLVKFVQSLLPEQTWQSLKRRIMGRGGTGQPPVATEGEKPIHSLDSSLVWFYGSKTRVRIDKAKRILGYQPAFDLESGVRLTEQWARWANLLNE